jgi:hypothetical protein
MIGLGALTAGGSAAFGTEAFTSVEAERNVDVTIAGDQSAFVAIQPLSGANAGEYVATESDNTVEINLDGDSDGSGQGVSQDAITQIEDLFRIVNQGSQSSSIYFEDGSDAVTFRVTRSTNTSTTGSNGESLEGADNSVELDVGEQVVVGMTVDTLTNDVSGQLLDSVTLFADSGASAPEQNIAQPQYIVTNSASAANEFSEIQAAVDAAESGAVIGIEGSFAPSPTTQITVDTADVTLTGFEGTPTIDLTGASPSGTSAGAIQVTANGVTLRNFNIDYEADANGIEANDPGLTDITVDGMRVENKNTPSETPAITLEKAESVTVTNNEVLGAAIGTYFEDTNQNTSTISNNFVDLNPGEEGNATNPTEGIFAFGSGVPNTEFEIRNNKVVDKSAGEEGIKIVNSPSSVNGESGTEAQLETLLGENDIFKTGVNGDLGTKSSGFSDLQSAINGASRLTLVDSGSFDEFVSISSDGLILKGPNAGVAYDGSRGDEAIISAPSGERAIDVTGAGVTIDGLRAEGDGDGVVVASGDGGDLEGTITIRNSIIRADDSNGRTNGVLVSDNSDPGGPKNATITKNDIESGVGAAVNVFNGGASHGTVEVLNNEIRGDPGGLRAIEDLTVEKNDIFPLGNPEKALDVSGITNSATIDSNTFTGDPGKKAYNDDDQGDDNGTTATEVKDNNTFVPNGTVNDTNNEVEFSQ